MWQHKLGLHKTKVYTDNVSLKYFGKHLLVSANPLRWHYTLALMKMDLIHKVAHDNMVREALNKREVFKARTTISTLVASVCR
jgi:hypothetical protein